MSAHLVMCACAAPLMLSSVPWWGLFFLAGYVFFVALEAK